MKSSVLGSSLLIVFLVVTRAPCADIFVSLDANTSKIFISSDGTVELVGLDLMSEVDAVSNEGYLVPESDPSPFGFFLSSSDTRVALGLLGDTLSVTSTPTELPVAWAVEQDELFNSTHLIAQAGLATAGGGDVAPVVDVTVVPEPASGVLIAIGLLSASMLRRRGRRQDWAPTVSSRFLGLGLASQAIICPRFATHSQMVAGRSRVKFEMAL